MEPVQGEPWPVGRACYDACCLNYGDDHPIVLVYGGRNKNQKTLGDMWMLDVNAGKWTEVMMSFTHCFSDCSYARVRTQAACNQGFSVSH